MPQNHNTHSLLDNSPPIAGHDRPMQTIEDFILSRIAEEQTEIQFARDSSPGAVRLYGALCIFEDLVGVLSDDAQARVLANFWRFHPDYDDDWAV